MSHIRRDLAKGSEWGDYGKYLEYLTLHKENYQYRLIGMWESAHARNLPEGREVLFEEIEISEELYKKFKEMIEKEKKN